MAGCSPSPASDPADTEVRVESVVNVDTGAVAFPDELFYASLEENDLLTTATSLAIATCAQARGVDFRASGTPSHSTLYESSNYFGVWTESAAERFGFVPPMTNRDLIANGVSGAPALTDVQLTATPEQPDLSLNVEIAAHNSALSEDEFAVIAECANGEAAKVFDLRAIAPAGPWSQPLGEVHRAFNQDDVVKETYSQLNECLEREGLQPDESAPGMPIGADSGSITEDQVVMALTVVDCKAEVEFVDRLAARMAELQAPIINKYFAELSDQRSAIERAVEQARELVSSS